MTQPQRVGVSRSTVRRMSTPTVAARPAATVVLLRDAPAPGPGGATVQVFLQRRVAGMAFAGGMTVFPGGGVDTGDRLDPALWRGPEPEWWARQFGCTPADAARLVVAAVRETFEECGVLLAGPGAAGALPSTLLRGTTCWRRRRTLGDVLQAAGLPLRADLLAPWARWVTPEAEPRRDDTAFFVAAVPPGRRQTPGRPRPSRRAGGTRRMRWRARTAASCASCRPPSTLSRRSPSTPTWRPFSRPCTPADAGPPAGAAPRRPTRRRDRARRSHAASTTSAGWSEMHPTYGELRPVTRSRRCCWSPTRRR